MSARRRPAKDIFAFFMNYHNFSASDRRQWAQDCDFAAENLFQKFFFEDIKYLLSMDKLWAKRKKPEPLNWKELPEEADVEKEKENTGIKDQKVWSIKKCAMMFEESLGKLKDRHKVRKLK